MTGRRRRILALVGYGSSSNLRSDKGSGQDLVKNGGLNLASTTRFLFGLEGGVWVKSGRKG